MKNLIYLIFLFMINFTFCADVNPPSFTSVSTTTNDPTPTIEWESGGGIKASGTYRYYFSSYPATETIDTLPDGDPKLITNTVTSFTPSSDKADGEWIFQINPR